MQAMEHQEHHGQGEKAFVTSVLLAIGVIAGATLVGVGLRFHWLTLLLGLASCGVLMFAAEGLYSGRRVAAQVLQAWVALAALLGVALALLALLAPARLEEFRLPGVGVTWLIVVQCAMVVLVGAVAFGSRDARGFLAARRGAAAAPVTLDEEDVALVLAEGKPALAERQRQAVAALRRDLLAGTGLLSLLGLAGIAGAIYLMVWTAAGFGFATVGLLLAGLIAAFLGQVLLTASGDMDHLATTRGYEVAHLGYAAGSFQMALNVLMVATGLFVLLLVAGLIWG